MDSGWIGSGVESRIHTQFLAFDGIASARRTSVWIEADARAQSDAGRTAGPRVAGQSRRRGGAGTTDAIVESRWRKGRHTLAKQGREPACDYHSCTPASFARLKVNSRERLLSISASVRSLQSPYAPPLLNVFSYLLFPLRRLRRRLRGDIHGYATSKGIGDAARVSVS